MHSSFIPSGFCVSLFGNGHGMNYPALRGRGIPFGASSFSGFHPYPKGQGIPAAKINQIKLSKAKRISNISRVIQFFQ
jgi:hypothetical protein